jgi:hypothetical protein
MVAEFYIREKPLGIIKGEDFHPRKRDSSLAQK